MLQCSLFSLLRAVSEPLSVGFILNLRTLAANALYETYNIHVAKKCNRFFLGGHKLYESPQS